jgi:transketolase
MSELAARAAEVRRIAMGLIYSAGSGHPGSCLSAADLIAALYFDELRREGGAGAGDRFVLSKGHACPALYAALYLRGFFDRGALCSFRRAGGLLQGSPTTAVPGVDATSGSLGQGFSIALGMALGFRQLRRIDRVYVMLGDGELQEGEVWEAAMAAAHFRLGTLCAIVDYNRMQSDDLNERIIGLEPLEDKWRAFNWNVRAIDGHDFRAIDGAFDAARASADRPTVILARTTKGKGVRYMEGVPAWHGSVALKPQEIEQALVDLGVPPARHGEYAFHA